MIRDRNTPWIAAIVLLLSAAPLAAQTADVPAEPPLAPEASGPEVAVQPAPVVLEAAPPAPTPLAAPEPSPRAEAEIDRERVERALVEYDTSWTTGYGVLVQDASTVVVPAPRPDAGRGITLRSLRGDAEVEAAAVELAEPRSASQRFWILGLESPMDGVPLAVSEDGPVLGGRVFTLTTFSAEMGMFSHETEEMEFELVETTVTSVSETQFTLGFGGGLGFEGAPVLDPSGRILGVLGEDGAVVRIERILAQAERQPRPMSILPQFGVLGFYEWGGLGEGSGGVRIRFGLALWDQLGIQLNLGVNGGMDDHVARLAPVNGSGAGMVNVEDVGLDAGLDLEYRLLLARTTMPFFLKFVVGVRYSYMSSDPVGVPLYASSPSCDPFSDACRLVSGPTPDTMSTHGVGLSVGADLSWGGVTLGYRFLPGDAAYQLPDTHTLLFGISAF